MSSNQNFKNQILLNLVNLDNQIELDKSIVLVKSKMNKLNESNKLNNLNEFRDDIQMMLAQFKKMLTKLANLNDELDRKEAIAKLINKSIVKLPILFGEMIDNFQDNDLLIKLKNDFELLSEDMLKSKINLTINQDQINECLNDQKKQQLSKTKLDDELKNLGLKCNELISKLEACKEANNRLIDELYKVNEQHNQTHTSLVKLNSSLAKMQQEKEDVKNKLNEKSIKFNQMKDKKKHLLNGTYVNEETENFKLQIDQKKEQLKLINKQIGEIKTKNAEKSNQQIKLPKLKDENLIKQIKTPLSRLARLVEQNYQDKYLVFDNSQLIK